MSEPELEAHAQTITVARPAGARLVRAGAVAFWGLVGVLILARVALVDPASLKPIAASGSAASLTVASLIEPR